MVASITAPTGVRLATNMPSLALSPNGEALAFVGTDTDGQTHLYLRRLDSETSRRVEGTETVLSAFWSPDGREIAFFADAGLLRVATGGATPRLVTDHVGWDGAWSLNGTILFSACSVYGRMSASNEITALKSAGRPVSSQLMLRVSS